MNPEPLTLPPRVTFRARYVFPVAWPPIAGGEVTIRGQHVVAVGAAAGGSGTRDLGNVAVVPGLVNAHAHLDLSDLPAPLAADSFVDWLRCAIGHRRDHPPAADAVELGLCESIRRGTTLVGDIAQPGFRAATFAEAPLDCTEFLELIAPTLARVPEAVARAEQHAVVSRQSSVLSFQSSVLRGYRPGLSPHAPYTVHPQLLERAVAISAAARVPLAMHLAESREEIELLRNGSGPLREFLEERGAWEPGAIPSGTRPLSYLRVLAAADRALAIHGNYLDDEEIAFLAVRRERMSVVYCPRTHAFFGHSPYPLERLLAAGVRVALGTDSRASAPDLSILGEMRQIARAHPRVSLEAVLRLATLDGAAALGLAAETGSIEPGKLADLTLIALPDRDDRDPHALLLDSDLPVVGRIFRGRE